MMLLDWPSGATVEGVPLPERPDLERMRRERYQRLQDQMSAQGVDGLVLLGGNSVSYATGAVTPGADAARAGLFRNVAVVAAGAAEPHLYTAVPDGAPPGLPADHIHPALLPDLDDGIGAMVAAVTDLFPAGARLAVDEQTHPMLDALGSWEWVDASGMLGPAKVQKTVDEVACIRSAQRINELAMRSAQEALRPGVRQSDLSGIFLRQIFEMGATFNAIDPIWQVMEPTRAMGPWTVHGDLAFPTSTTDRFLREGDVIWVDSGIGYQGYASDFGRTWITAARLAPTDRQRSQYRRWRAVVDAALSVCKPGATALEMARAATAANDGKRPWIEHFYLAHGVGTESAEMPLIGTDLGEDFDESLVMAPGMVLVLEPVIWDEGHAGYRAEDLAVVTDDGWAPLSEYPYDPYEGES